MRSSGTGVPAASTARDRGPWRMNRRSRNVSVGAARGLDRRRLCARAHRQSSERATIAGAARTASFDVCCSAPTERPWSTIRAHWVRWARDPAIEPTEHAVEDILGRPLHDLRISVTDRCNFRCTYCMPKEIFGPDFAFLPRSEVLTFEEIDAGRARVRRARRREAPDHRRRAARPARPAGPHRDARGAPPARRRAARPDADDERIRAAAAGRAAPRRRPASGSRSASTRSTTRRSRR